MSGDCTTLDREASFIPITEIEHSLGSVGEQGGVGGDNGGLDPGIIGYKGCHPVVGPEHESPNIHIISTKKFDGYRSARLAPMVLLKGERLAIFYHIIFFFFCVILLVLLL